MKQPPFVIPLRYSPVLLLVLFTIHCALVVVACVVPALWLLKCVACIVVVFSALWQLRIARLRSGQMLCFHAAGTVSLVQIRPGLPRWENDVLLLSASQDFGGWLIVLCWQDRTGHTQRFTFLRDGMSHDEWRKLRIVVRWLPDAAEAKDAG